MDRLNYNKFPETNSKSLVLIDRAFFVCVSEVLPPKDQNDPSWMVEKVTTNLVRLLCQSSVHQRGKQFAGGNFFLHHFIEPTQQGEIGQNVPPANTAEKLAK